MANYPIFTYNTSDKESERYLIAQLSRNNLATQKELAHYFNVNLKTIKNYKSRFLHQGSQGILYKRPSLDEPRKTTPQVVREVLAYYFKHSAASENEIAKQVSSRLGFPISQPSVGRILEQCGFKVEGRQRGDRGTLSRETEGRGDRGTDRGTLSKIITFNNSIQPTACSVG